MPRRKNEAVVAVFAHPDDEAFGPGGTLAKFAKGKDVYLLCVTKGDVGGSQKVAQERANELQKSAKILGIKRVFSLGFTDGKLSNSIYHHLADKIQEKLAIFKPEILITFEPRGISGHIDHITVSMVTTYVFKRLPFTKRLLYYCIDEKSRKTIDDYFIYFPPGYKRGEIDMTVDIEDVWEQKRQAMLAHRSQLNDAQRLIKLMEKLPKKEYFIVVKK